MNEQFERFIKSLSHTNNFETKPGNSYAKLSYAMLCYNQPAGFDFTLRLRTSRV